MVRIHFLARVAQRREQLLDHHRAERLQVPLRSLGQPRSPLPLSDRCQRHLHLPGRGQSRVAPVLVLQEVSQRQPRLALGSVVEHPRGRRLLSESPRRLIHQEVPDQSRIISRLLELLRELCRLLPKVRMEHIWEIPEHPRCLPSMEIKRPHVRESRRLRDLPLRPVRNGVEPELPQHPQRDLAPLPVPIISPERADEVRSQVVD